MKRVSVLDREEEKAPNGLMFPMTKRRRRYHASKSRVRYSEEFEFHRGILRQISSVGPIPQDSENGSSSLIDVCTIQQKFETDEYIMTDSRRNFKYYFDEDACVVDIRLVLSNYMLCKQPNDALCDRTKRMSAQVNKLIIERETRLAVHHEEIEHVSQGETVKIDVDTSSAQFPDVPVETTGRGTRGGRPRRGAQVTKNQQRDPESLDKEWEIKLREEVVKVKTKEMQAANKRLEELQQAFKVRESKLNENLARMEREATEAASKHRLELEKKDKEWGARLQDSIVQGQKKAEALERLKGMELENSRRGWSNVVAANLARAKKDISDAREKHKAELNRKELAWKRVIAEEFKRIDESMRQHKAELDQKDRAWQVRLIREVQAVKDNAAKTAAEKEEVMEARRQRVHDALETEQRWRLQAEEREKKLKREKSILQEALDKALERESNRDREACFQAQREIDEGKRRVAEWEAKISRQVEELKNQGEDEVGN
eukprot:GFKZ01007363.1.p1 GENE.GFKZ01007363.1~~GFKZ01007363.1.p1  ORF type:complete len:490 (+),score=96.88 GFKZ01007363.1:148-1617(+)